MPRLVMAMEMKSGEPWLRKFLEGSYLFLRSGEGPADPYFASGGGNWEALSKKYLTRDRRVTAVKRQSKEAGKQEKAWQRVELSICASTIRQVVGSLKASCRPLIP